MTQAKLIYRYWFGDVSLHAYSASAGEGLTTHSHEYTHLTLCASGKISITDGEQKLELSNVDQPYELIKDQDHEIVALEDNTVFINIVYQRDVRGGVDRDPRIEIINGMPVVRY